MAKAHSGENQNQDAGLEGPGATFTPKAKPNCNPFFGGGLRFKPLRSGSNLAAMATQKTTPIDPTFGTRRNDVMDFDLDSRLKRPIMGGKSHNLAGFGTIRTGATKKRRPGAEAPSLACSFSQG